MLAIASKEGDLKKIKKLVLEDGHNVNAASYKNKVRTFFSSKNHDRMTDSFRKPNNNKNVKATNLMAHTSFNTFGIF